MDTHVYKMMLKSDVVTFEKINNCILRNKLTKKYVDHSAFCADHAHIYI